ncbi:DUF4174 domain-containing protein [Mycobacterium sp. CPCC 205372]|uniref:DUF4174 domain-containing protein n=1 Tax=Mycobacterium hippophais TaxID=3016340 RepID=A0ABT4PUL3_9MYCO|nr:DUF4174 domain-containing protein [Mycobacterium hippophais]MCZ8380235.1 DUF4174 domain-containing protein [Mycobacterium hippophais]
MAVKSSARRLAFMLVALVASATLGSAPAAATELSDYRWERRPLLVFAPTDRDPRLVETLSRVEATRCDFVSRAMVLGLVVSEGNSALDGHAVDAGESKRLVNQFAIAENAFTVLLIGKDGAEKLRVNEAPDLQAVYALIDGMPMRSREMSADPGRC